MSTLARRYDQRMSSTARSLRIARFAAVITAAFLLASCDGNGYDSPISSPAAHPPATNASAAAGITSTPAGDPSPEPTASTGALPVEQLPLVEFVRADGSAVSLPVEVVPRAEYSIGLSGRYTLDERGMLFYYEDPAQRSGFWMKNTHIDLTLAFANDDGEIVAIEDLVAESEEIVKPEPEYQYIVEAPAGWYAAHGIAVGDTLRLAFDLDDWLR